MYMSETTTEKDAGQLSHRDAKAQAKAAKAYAKAQRPWFKKKRFIIPLAIVAIAVMTQMGGGGDTSASSSEDTSTAEVSSGAQSESEGGTTVDASEAAAGLNDAVRDGKFEFQVKDFECGETKIGSGFLAEKAQGQFCVATVKVSNIGDEAQMFDGTSQYLYDEQGREFEASTEAAIVLPASKSFLEDINPGNTVTGKVIWDVPSSGFKADHLELHDSMFSDGVEVTLK
jgi:hypothetical protein